MVSLDGELALNQALVDNLLHTEHPSFNLMQES